MLTGARYAEGDTQIPRAPAGSLEERSQVSMLIVSSSEVTELTEPPQSAQISGKAGAKDEVSLVRVPSRSYDGFLVAPRERWTHRYRGL